MFRRWPPTVDCRNTYPEYVQCGICGKLTNTTDRTSNGKWWCENQLCQTAFESMRFSMMMELHHDPEWRQHQSNTSASSSMPSSWRGRRPLEHNLGFEYEVRRLSMLRIQARYDEAKAVSQYTLRVVARGAFRHGWVAPLLNIRKELCQT